VYQVDAHEQVGPHHGMVTKIVNYFHATFLFKIALRASRAKSGSQGQPVVCIVFCATALEAFINECGRLNRSLRKVRLENPSIERTSKKLLMSNV
jgi:hypothetical protein